MKPKTWTHPKFAVLSAALGTGRATTAGILEGLWHLAATFDPEGGALPYTPRQLAAWLEVDADPDTLAAALVDGGWLEGESGAYRVHDWDDHKPGYIREAERKRAYRTAKTCPDNVPGQSRDNPRTSRDNPGAADHSDSDSVCNTESPNGDSPHNAPRGGAANGVKLFVIPLTGGASYRLPADRVTEYCAAYPWDVPAEIAKAVLWLKDNPDRRPRSHRGAAAFVTRWMNRHDDRQRANGPRGDSGELSADEYRKDLDRRTRKTIAYVTGGGE